MTSITFKARRVPKEGTSAARHKQLEAKELLNSREQVLLSGLPGE